MIAIPSWFYAFAGAVLVISGVLQLALRPRGQGIWRFFGPGPLFSFFSIVLGLLVVFYGIWQRSH